MNDLYTKTVKKLLRDCRGSLTIEFAILFPVLFLLLVGGIEFGMVVVEKMQLEFATEGAAKCFATRSSSTNPNPSLPCVDDPTTGAYAAGLLAPGWGISASNFSATKMPPINPVSGCVTASYSYTPMILPTPPIPLGTTACYPIT